MKKILVVEDNTMNMTLFYDILTYKQYDVTKAYDGIEAYNLILKNRFDLIILDIQLPKLNGFELIDKLKKEKIEFPEIIMVSAYAMDSDKQKALEYGIKTYITKPIDINNFINSVQNCFIN